MCVNEPSILNSCVLDELSRKLGRVDPESCCIQNSSAARESMAATYLIKLAIDTDLSTDPVEYIFSAFAKIKLALQPSYTAWWIVHTKNLSVGPCSMIAYRESGTP